jgi:hypothetical protein
MQLVTEGLMTATSPGVDKLSAPVKQSDLKTNLPKELVDIAFRLQREISSAFREAIERAGLSSEIRLSFIPPPPLGGRGGLILSSRHLDKGSEIWTQVNITVNSKRFPFSFITQDSHDSLQVRLKDVHPELTEAFKLRLDGLVLRQLGRLLAELGETGS